MLYTNLTGTPALHPHEFSRRKGSGKPA